MAISRVRSAVRAANRLAEVGTCCEQYDAGQRHDSSQKATRRPSEKVADHTGAGQFEFQPDPLPRVLSPNTGGNRIEFSLHLG